MVSGLGAESDSTSATLGSTQRTDTGSTTTLLGGGLAGGAADVAAALSGLGALALGVTLPDDDTMQDIFAEGGAKDLALELDQVLGLVRLEVSDPGLERGVEGAEGF